ncbi:SURF1 family protein [Sinimarinibacterium sp. CAU 1509]|uniref:SURF1 family protein n=1 Tax=Sinimarinibacterium sp. CAU 1509 TaxID=2562283 RepID=UPI0010AB9F80|nr:SURF1 family protein [Sinimarinibacterium sp. CAU 1509]TJY59501.1 SURF1 family protein [Sinimarinibacterium sp. CAU 1509]
MSTATPRPSSIPRLLAFGGVLLALFVLFMALGHWQVQRRAWKLELIEQVERYQTAEPEAAPPPAQWPKIGKADEYRRITLGGVFEHARETCVQAVTVQGPGYWVLTPLQTTDGTRVLINRGFVDQEHCEAATRTGGQIDGPVTVVGRLRLSEPKGGFLRDNDPVANRWYSRDVAQIAAARGLDPAQAAPYFIDAEASVAGGPVGGLTVIHFRNHHLGYALTWYGLAAMVALAAAIIARREWRLRHQ